MDLKYIPIEQISLPPGTPVRPPLITPAEIETAQSSGVVSPIMVRTTEQPRSYHLVGEGRGWWIAQQAMIPTVPSLITDLSPEEVSELQSTQGPLTQALAWKQIYDQEFEHKPRGALTRTAQRLGIPKPSLHRWLKLLKLDDKILDMIDQGELTPSVAGLLLELSPEQRLFQANRLIGKSYSAALKLLGKKQGTQQTSTNSTGGNLLGLFDDDSEDPELAYLERELAELVGLPARLRGTGQGGVLAFRYHNLDELEGLMQRLGWISDPEF